MTPPETIAVITGCTRGIGRALTLQLAETGAHLVLLARSEAKLARLDDLVQKRGGSATLVPVDLAEPAALDALGPLLAERFGRVDLLVAAAAHMPRLTPLAHVTPEDWDKTLAVNLTANFRLLRTLDPLFRQATAPQAVLLTDSHSGAYWGSYGVSKAGLEALAAIYAAEMHQTPLNITTFDPGPVATQLHRTAFPGDDPATLQKPEEAAAKIMALLTDEA